MDKATRAQVKRHNRRLVMRALFEEQADNRAALAIETGLTKPTIGTIINELIHSGYVVEDGFGNSTRGGGKRPTIIRFLPVARQVIGVSIHTEEIIAGLANLDGTIIARHHTRILPDDDIVYSLQCTINALLTQNDVPVVAIGIGIPGIVDENGVVEQSPIKGLDDVPLAARVQKMFRIPCYVSNNTALVARIQVKQSLHQTTQLVTVSVGDVIEVGSTFGGDTYQQGGDISQIPVPGTDSYIGALQWQTVKQDMASIAAKNPDSVLNSQKLSYLLLRRAVHLGEGEAKELLNHLATLLAHSYRLIIGLMRPSEIVLTGSLSLSGDVLLDMVDKKLQEQLPVQTLSRVRLTLAQSDYLSMQGAVVFALQEELGIV